MASPDFGAYRCFEDVLHRINIFFLNRINIIFFLECIRGGAKPSEKCPVQPSDLVLIHNHIMEALAKPDTEINEDYDFWNAARTLKAPYVKFCNAYKSRVRVAR